MDSTVRHDYVFRQLIIPAGSSLLLWRTTCFKQVEKREPKTDMNCTKPFWFTSILFKNREDEITNQKCLPDRLQPQFQVCSFSLATEMCWKMMLHVFYTGSFLKFDESQLVCLFFLNSQSGLEIWNLNLCICRISHQWSPWNSPRAL